MARSVKVELVDDVTGDPADETVTYALDGQTYEIDLTAQGAKDLRDDLANWIEHSRRVGRNATSRRSGTSRRAKDGRGAKIRQWARDRGMSVPDRGRLPAEVIKAYDEADVTWG